MLDTIVNRLGTLLGAGYFSLCLRLGVSPEWRRLFILVLALIWEYLTYRMACLSAVTAATAITDDREPVAAAASDVPLPDAQTATTRSAGAAPLVPITRTWLAHRPWAQSRWVIDREFRESMLWLLLFCATGIGLGQTFELLQMHAGPARPATFLTSFFGYWAQLLVAGAAMLLSGSWRARPPDDSGDGHGKAGDGGAWTVPAAVALVSSSFMSGVSQGLDYVAQLEGGYMLYTILHSSVIFFACGIAVIVLQTRIAPGQFAGATLVVLGLLATALPQPLAARRSFLRGVVASSLGSLFLAASYPLTELTFRLARVPPPEELAAFYGALINVTLYTAWTVAYTLPRWHELVVMPMYDADVAAPSVRWAVLSYTLHAVLVGVHSLAFFKSVRRLGSVPTAISKGAQQACSAESVVGEEEVAGEWWRLRESFYHQSDGWGRANGTQ